MIHNDRIQKLNDNSIKAGNYVLYWMQASQRVEFNHALKYAIKKANRLNQSIIVFFGITDKFPEANERHYQFMIEGLKEICHDLEDRGITMVIWHMNPDEGVIELSKNASLVVVDRGYLKIQKIWRKNVAKSISSPLIQVESDVIVPIENTSNKEEFSAATIRPKIMKKINYFLKPLKKEKLKKSSSNFEFENFDINNIKQSMSKLNIDRSVNKSKEFKGGISEAKKKLRDFKEHKLDLYAEKSNDPVLNICSNMSPYLHFGQISPLYIALCIIETDSPGKDAYLDELIVRRELSMNFTYYNKNYDNFSSLPNWARKTLFKHSKDKRDIKYNLRELERAETHDPYWNAAQKEMTKTGKMHGYMRMYWGKKIIEWTNSPQEAHKLALYMNNKYELDGRDPNGFAGIAWCFGKHDRPWKERLIFGKIRYMNDKGLKRKFDIDKYAKKYN